MPRLSTTTTWWPALLLAFAASGNAAAASPVSVHPAQLIPGETATITYAPPRGARGSVFVHYGFNGWNVPLSGPGAGSEIDEGNTNYFVDQRLTAAADGSDRLTTSVAVPRGARAMHMAFCWNQCRPGEWDNNGGKDYSWSVTFPYIGPLLTWNAATEPSTGMVVTFESSWESTGWLKVWRDGQAPVTHQSANGTLHRFELSGLLPATRYSYQVGVPGGFSSAVYSFRTARAGSDKVSFVAFGDAQDNGENGRFAAIADAIVREHADVDMIVSTGDMPWNDKPGDWWSFFDKGRAMFAGHAFMPVVGNHDTPLPGVHPDHTSFSRYFSLPGTTADRAFYRYAVGPATFFGMNSDRSPELYEGGRQYRWLADGLRAQRAAVARADGPRWTFVLWHIPPFNAGARHWQAQYQFRPITQFFDGVVDWQIGGHEHLGQRFKPTRRGARDPIVMTGYGNASDQGVGYVIVPGGGVTPEQRLVPTSVERSVRGMLAFPVLDDHTDRIEPYLGFSRFDIDGAQLSLKTYSVVSPVAGRRTVIKDQITYEK